MNPIRRFKQKRKNLDLNELRDFLEAREKAAADARRTRVEHYADRLQQRLAANHFKLRPDGYLSVHFWRISRADAEALTALLKDERGFTEARYLYHDSFIGWQILVKP